MNAPDGRAVFIWRGKDPVEDTRRLTEAVAEAGMMELFEVDGAMVWRHDGQTVGVSRNRLHEIVTKLIVTVRLMPSGEVEFYPFDFSPSADTGKAPDQQTLAVMLTDLKSMVAKGPSAPQRLSPQQQEEIRYRVGIGEPPDRLASSYGVDRDTIRQLAAR